MNTGENWEANLDWSKFDPIGGMPFYLFVRDTCMATVENSIGALAKMKSEQADKIERWGRIARSAGLMEEGFKAFADTVGTTSMVEFIDTKIKLMYPKEVMTITVWLDFGRHITRAFRNGSLVPQPLKDELVDTERNLAYAQTLYAFLQHYLKIAKGDYKLRNAPDKFKTRVFRDFASTVKEMIEIGGRLNCETGPQFIRVFSEQIERIKDMAVEANKTCRLAKREIERKGTAFWTELAAWRSGITH